LVPIELFNISSNEIIEKIGFRVFDVSPVNNATYTSILSTDRAEYSLKDAVLITFEDLISI
jgi:hypothetical protein